MNASYEFGIYISCFYEGRDSVKAKFSEHRRGAHPKKLSAMIFGFGERSIIKQGVTISTGAVIGMGSVVTKDVAPYSIVVISSAKEIRKRFDELTIAQLLNSEWWCLQENELKKYAQYFMEPA